MTRCTVLIFLFLALTMNFSPATGVSRAEDTSPFRVQLPQKTQASPQRLVLEGAQAVRPTLKERDAVSQLLTMKPRPKTLPDADMKYLKALRDKATWLGFERRIVHEMWTKATGKEWHDPEVSQTSKSEKSP